MLADSSWSMLFSTNVEICVYSLRLIVLSARRAAIFWPKLAQRVQWREGVV